MSSKLPTSVRKEELGRENGAVRWGLRCARNDWSWPDRSALAPAVGELVFKKRRAALARVGRFVGTALANLRCFALSRAHFGGFRLVPFGGNARGGI